MRRRLAVALAAALALAAGAHAMPQQQGSVDLLNQSDGQWDGPGEAQGGSEAGAAIVGLTDLLHDGRAAFAIGAPEANPGGRLGAGSVYVVAGQKGTGAVDLTALAGRGFRIDGADAGDQLGFALASLTLPDGHPGLAIGAPYANPSHRQSAGVTYVIDLRRLRRNVDLSLTPLPKAVVGVLSGPAACAESGYSLAAGHDQRRPPRAGSALAVGAPGVDAHGCPVTKPSGPVGGNTCAVFVVAPHALVKRVDLAAPGGAAATLNGAASGDRTGAAVSALPGLNTGFLIGAPYASPLGRAGAGVVYVVRGTLPAKPAGLATGASVATFEGAVADDELGASVATTAGFARGQPPATLDLVLGAPQASPLGRSEAGEVILASPDTRGTVDLNASGTRIGTIAGADPGDEAGYAVAGVGSLNGSRIGSLAIGAPFTNSQTGVDRIDNGAVYALYGGIGGATADLAHLRDRGFLASGARNSDEAGTAVASVTGEAGDSRADLLIGAPFAESAFGATPTEGGAVYSVLGWGQPVLHYPHTTLRLRVGRALAPQQPVVERTGGARFSVIPALPAGLRLNSRTGTLGGRPRHTSPITRYTIEMDDDAGAVTVTLTLSVASR